MNQETTSRKKKFWKTLCRGASHTRQVAGDAVRKGAKGGKQIASNISQTAQDTTGKVQRKIGEDYYAILDENPVVKDTISRAPLLEKNKELLDTAFNIPWTSTLFWSGAAGTVVALQVPIDKMVGQLVHYGPGHIKRWKEISQFMDTVSGRGHRLKYGHSIDILPTIVKKFGLEGVPAYFLHIAQDFTTVDGIPIIPNAWEVKEWLQKSLNAKTATGLVSISFSRMLGAMAVFGMVQMLWKFGDAAIKRRRVRKHLEIATQAIQNRDYNAAVANYQRVLEFDRSPAVLMSLGQVYMQRPSNRFRAHKAFTETVTLLADRPTATVPYKESRLSIRGLAGIQALSTAEVLADIHPEYWNDHVRDLVNATVFSFTSTAVEQAQQDSKIVVPGAIVTPSYFSAAINYYLAAKSACYYPLTEERRDVVVSNLQSARSYLGLVAQYDETQLRQPISTIRQLWARELLPPNETDIALATY